MKVNTSTFGKRNDGLKAVILDFYGHKINVFSVLLYVSWKLIFQNKKIYFLINLFNVKCHCEIIILKCYVLNMDK